MSTAISTDPPQAVLKRIYRAFFGPTRYEVKPAEQEILEGGNNYRLPFAEGELAVTTWGSSRPAVLLMHGWAVRARSDDRLCGSSLVRWLSCRRL